MTHHIEAVFSGGVLKPDRDLGLRERQRVRLIVETVDEVAEDRQAALARLRARHDAAYVEALQRLFEAHLERARRFVWSLSVRPEQDAAVRIVVFGGDCSLTPARLLVEEMEDDSAVRLYPGDIARPRPGLDYARLMLEPGDGQVTKPSLLARWCKRRKRTAQRSTRPVRQSAFPAPTTARKGRRRMSASIPALCWRSSGIRKLRSMRSTKAARRLKFRLACAHRR